MPDPTPQQIMASLNLADGDPRREQIRSCISNPAVMARMRAFVQANVNYAALCTRHDMRDDSSLGNPAVPEADRQVYAAGAYHSGRDPIFLEFKAAHDQQRAADNALRNSIATVLRATYPGSYPDSSNTDLQEMTRPVWSKITLELMYQGNAPVNEALQNLILPPAESRRTSQSTPAQSDIEIRLTGESPTGTLMAVLRDNQGPVTGGGAVSTTDRQV